MDSQQGGRGMERQDIQRGGGKREYMIEFYSLGTSRVWEASMVWRVMLSVLLVIQADTSDSMYFEFEEPPAYLT